MLSEKRYKHSIKTMEKAQDLAKLYNVNVDKASVAGLFHDLGKEYPKSEGLELFKENNINIEKKHIDTYYLYHGLTGRLLAKRDFYIEDEEILDAIENHVMLVEAPSKLEMITYLADMIEETRLYPGVEEIRRLSSMDLEKAVLESLNLSLKNLINENKWIEAQTVKSRNYLLNKMIRRD